MFMMQTLTMTDEKDNNGIVRDYSPIRENR